MKTRNLNFPCRCVACNASTVLKLTICAWLLLTTSFAGSMVTIPDGASITVPGGAYFCAGEIVVELGGSFQSDSPDDVCVQPTGTGDISLPVELSLFTANLEASSYSPASMTNAPAREKTCIVLEWETASETENLGFVLERVQHPSDIELTHRGSRGIAEMPSQNGGTDIIGGTGPSTSSGTDDWTEIASYLTHPELQGQGSTTMATRYRFVDETIEAGSVYDYRLGDVAYDGTIVYHSQQLVGIEIPIELPESHVLYQNYPNPFNPSTIIRYGLSEDTRISLDIYDLRGQHVVTLDSGKKTAGYYRCLWNGLDKRATRIPGGVYFFVLKTPDRQLTRKLLVLK